MPDIEWTDKFRAAVIEQVAGRVRDGVVTPHCNVMTIHFLSLMDSAFLSMNAAKIEAALGCTLADVKEEMEQNG